MFKTPRREGRQPSVTRLEVLPGDSVKGFQNREEIKDDCRGFVPGFVPSDQKNRVFVS